MEKHIQPENIQKLARPFQRCRTLWKLVQKQDKVTRPMMPSSALRTSLSSKYRLTVNTTKTSRLA